MLCLPKEEKNTWENARVKKWKNMGHMDMTGTFLCFLPKNLPNEGNRNRKKSDLSILYRCRILMPEFVQFDYTMQALRRCVTW